jgi:hypothetical protein
MFLYWGMQDNCKCRRYLLRNANISWLVIILFQFSLITVMVNNVGINTFRLQKLGNQGNHLYLMEIVRPKIHTCVDLLALGYTLIRTILHLQSAIRKHINCDHTVHCTEAREGVHPDVRPDDVTTNCRTSSDRPFHPVQKVRACLRDFLWSCSLRAHTETNTRRAWLRLQAARRWSRPALFLLAVAGPSVPMATHVVGSNPTAPRRTPPKQNILQFISGSLH